MVVRYDSSLKMDLGGASSDVWPFHAMNNRTITSNEPHGNPNRVQPWCLLELMFWPRAFTRSFDLSMPEDGLRRQTHLQSQQRIQITTAVSNISGWLTSVTCGRFVGVVVVLTFGLQIHYIHCASSQQIAKLLAFKPEWNICIFGANYLLVEVLITE